MPAGPPFFRCLFLYFGKLANFIHFFFVLNKRRYQIFIIFCFLFPLCHTQKKGRRKKRKTKMEKKPVSVGWQVCAEIVKNGSVSLRVPLYFWVTLRHEDKKLGQKELCERQKKKKSWTMLRLFFRFFYSLEIAKMAAAGEHAPPVLLLLSFLLLFFLSR